MKKTLAILLALLLLLSLCACGSSEDKLIGTWQMVSGAVASDEGTEVYDYEEEEAWIFVFQANGTCYMQYGSYTTDKKTWHRGFHTLSITDEDYDTEEYDILLLSSSALVLRQTVTYGSSTYTQTIKFNRVSR